MKISVIGGAGVRAPLLIGSFAKRAREIDLEEIHSSAAILDWIFQVLGKKWGDQETLHDLLLAFDEILKPQSNYCSFENDTKCDGGQLARKFANNLK